MAAFTPNVISLLRSIELNFPLEEQEAILKEDLSLLTKILKFIKYNVTYGKEPINKIRDVFQLAEKRDLKSYLSLLYLIDYTAYMPNKRIDAQKAIECAKYSVRLAKEVKEDTETAFLGGLYVGSKEIFGREPFSIAVDLSLSPRIIEAFLELSHAHESEDFLPCILKVAWIETFSLRRDESYRECLVKLKAKSSKKV